MFTNVNKEVLKNDIKQLSKNKDYYSIANREKILNLISLGSNNFSDEGLGGAIMAISGVNVVIQSSSFTRNRAAAGGAINLLQNSSLAVTDSYFSSNIAIIMGGAIWSLMDAVIHAKNTTFKNNSAGEAGAVSLDQNTTSHFLKCHFDYNSADLISGALLVLFNSTSTISNCKFNNNSAVFAGAIGGSMHSSVNIFNSSFISNSVKSTKSSFGQNHHEIFGLIDVFDTNGGGAMCFSHNSIANLSNNVFRMITAEIGGALFAATNVILHINHCSFINNTANEAGGCIAGIDNINNKCPQ